MPIGAETFLSPALQPVFDKLFSMGEDLISKLSGGELAKTLKQWKRQLRMIQAVLVDAEHKQRYSSAVKIWLDDLHDLAYDMEDILEHFAIEAHAHELNQMGQEDFGIFGSSTYKNLSTLFSPMNPDIQSEIDDINERLEYIQSQTRDFGLCTAHVMQQQTIQIQTEALRNKRESTYIECETKIYGRDDKKQEIIARLLKDDQNNKMNYVVIPIVGKGGVGKTTLAQYVYNDERQLKGFFDIKAWVCVSDVFDIKRMTTTIIKAAPVECGDLSNLNEAQDKLKQVLMGKKFLIVLDDIWNENYDAWDKLKRPFRDAAKGSRVIMTTRNEKIAHLMIDESMNSTIINLEGLPDDDCWCLFQQHVNVDSELAEMQDDIIRKCKGLPLAAKALGGLLKTTHKRHRNIILHSETWHESSDVLPVLRLSYSHLPSHLKHMFAYCSIFPKDYIFHEMDVVLLWMAQGFLPENQQGRLEDIGCMYFHDLVSRSLFEASQSSEEGFYMHDLIHDLALWAAGDTCYVMCTSDTPQRDLNRIRHVSFTTDATTLGNQIPRASQWRTFFSHDDVSIENLDLIQRFRYMRTLILSLDRINVLSECIGNLKHLRFLVLRFEKSNELPKSISNLCNLQTLVISSSNGEHIYVPNIGLLEKLRHLGIGEAYLEEMPMGIGKLTNLQSLDKFVLGDGRGERIRDLKNLNHLHGTLNLLGLESVLEVEDAKEAQLYKKDGLDELCLTGGIQRECVDDNTKRDVLEQLKPHTSIKQLKLRLCSGLTFPTWLGNPCFRKMVGINLECCKKCEYLPPLGQLPSLKNLSIEGMYSIKEIGAEFYGDLRCQNPSFPVLENLSFRYMRSWEKWLHSLAHDHAFPSLKELSIEDCCSLEGELPLHLPSLRKLIIKKCSELKVSPQSLPLLEVLELNDCIILFTDGAGCSSDMGAECLKELLIVSCPSLDGKLPLHLPSLRKLEIYRCKELSFSLQSLPSLRLLKINQCKKLSLSLQSLSLLEELELINCDILFTDGDGCSSDVGAECLKVPGELAYLTTLTIKDSQSRISLPEGLLLPALQYLKFWNCQNMESLPSQLHKYTSLKEITIDGCPKVQDFPQEGFPINLEELTIEQVNIKQPVQELVVHHLHSLRSLKLCYKGMTPEDLSLPSSLSDVHVSGSQNLKTISSCTPFSNVTSLEVCHCPMFESFVGNWTLLSKLVLKHCPSLTSSHEDLLLPALQDLEFWDCQSMECLPSQFHNFASLKSLVILNCPKLQGFPEGGLPINLEDVVIRGVNIQQPVQELAVHHLHSLLYLTLDNVSMTPEYLSLPSSLVEFRIYNSQNLKTISNFTTLPILTRLWVVDCPMFKFLVGNFTSISNLCVRQCPNFEFFVEDCSPRNLIRLTVDGRIDTDKPIREWGLHLLSSLETLHLINLGRSTTEAVECIPSPNLQLPSSLSHLNIDGFQNLESIKCSSFPNMTILQIEHCPKFQSFGEHGLPPKLKYVSTIGCEALKPHLKIDPHGPIHMEQHYSLL